MIALLQAAHTALSIRVMAEVANVRTTLLAVVLMQATVSAAASASSRWHLRKIKTTANKNPTKETDLQRVHY